MLYHAGIIVKAHEAALDWAAACSRQVYSAPLTILILIMLGILCFGAPDHARAAREGKGVATFLYGDREPTVPGLKRAWGFIALIEYDGKKILFNAAGEEEILKNNLEVLKIDPKEIDAVVISHQHWEMVQGLEVLFAENPGLKVFTPETVSEKLVKDYYPKREANFVEVLGDEQYTDNIIFMDLKSGRRRGGPLGIHEVIIVLKTDKGLVLFVGCGHPELLQIVHKSKQLTMEEDVHLLAGGMHLLPLNYHVKIEDSKENFFVPQSFDYTKDELHALSDRLKEAGVSHIMPTHCTMDPAESIFKETFGENYIYQTLGMKLEFPVENKPAAK